jgi:hypothetical protein
MSGAFIVEDGIGRFFAIDHIGHLIEEFEEAADDVLAYAQENAPWADRTGSARAELDVEVDEHLGEVTLTLAHGVDYGHWLEVIQNGRFAIILPTLEHFAPQIMRKAGAAYVGRTSE